MLTTSKILPGLSVEAVAAHLRDGIRHGHYAPGQRLVASELAHSLGVGLNVVREAFSALDGAGLVDVRPNRGATVCALGRKDIVEIFQIREVLEGLAAGLAAANIAQEGARKLMEEACARSREALLSRDPVAYHVANQNFHSTILELSGNCRLKRLAEEKSIPIYNRQFHSLLGDVERTNSDGEHQDLSSAILQGDCASAELIMRRHVRASSERLQRLVHT